MKLTHQRRRMEPALPTPKCAWLGEPTAGVSGIIVSGKCVRSDGWVHVFCLLLERL